MAGSDWKHEPFLRELYWNREMSTVDIGERFNVSDSYIGDVMEDLGVPRRGDGGVDRDEYPWRDEEKLREMYIEEGLSMEKIADQWDTAGRTICKWLHEYNIPTKTQRNQRPPSYHVGPNGYCRWRTAVDGTQHAVRVHRLLAVSECGLESLEGKYVHHINGLQWDNRPENIQIVDPKTHSEAHGNHGSSIGELPG